MDFRRMERIESQFEREIIDIIRRDLKDPRIGFVSVTRVSASGDLKHAKVSVSVYGTEAERKNALIGLQSAKGFIREQLKRRVRLRNYPELDFILDNSIEYSFIIEEKLKEIKKTDGVDGE